MNLTRKPYIYVAIACVLVPEPAITRKKDTAFKTSNAKI